MTRPNISRFAFRLAALIALSGSAAAETKEEAAEKELAALERRARALRLGDGLEETVPTHNESRAPWQVLWEIQIPLALRTIMALDFDHAATGAAHGSAPTATGESRPGRTEGGHGWRSPLGERLHRASAERSSLWAKGEAWGHCPIHTHGWFNGKLPGGVPSDRDNGGDLCHVVPGRPQRLEERGAAGRARPALFGPVPGA